MYKPNNKKMLTLFITLAMIFSAFAVLSLATQPAYATASGRVTYNPTTYGLTMSGKTGIPVQTVAFASGGTFASGATVYFYLSTTDSSKGLLTDSSGDYYAIGSVKLTSSSPTSLDQNVTFFPNGNVISISRTESAPALAPGVYYILASDSSPSSVQLNLASGTVGFAFPSVPDEFVAQIATLVVENLPASNALGLNALYVGGTALAYGANWDPGASVSIYLNYPGSSVVLATATANSFGVFSVTFTVPQLAGTVDTSYASITSPYNVVAQETNPYSQSTFPQGGITALSEMDVAPFLTVSPLDASGTAGTSITLTGTGFPGNQVVSANSITIVTHSGAIVATKEAQITVSANGQFTSTVTLSSSITGYANEGAETINIPFASFTSPYSMPSTPPDIFSFPDSFFISVPNPQELGFFFFPIPVNGLYYPTNPVIAAVYDFPASAVVSIYIGTTLVGNVTTDSNGFGELPATATIPAMPAGTYTVTAVDQSKGLVAVPNPSTITISPFFVAFDPANNMLTTGASQNNEYVPQNGTITVEAYGLAPNGLYNAFDSAVGSVYPSFVTAVQIGTPYQTSGMIPAANGTLEFSYSPFYGYYGVTTGTPVSITLTGISGFAGLPFGYFEIGAPSVTVTPGSLTPGGSVTVSVSNLISTPAAATYYPGTINYYNVYLGSSELATTAPVVKSFDASELSSVTFTVPSMVSGLYNVSVTYAGQPVSSALGLTQSAVAVVSTPGTSLSSGSMVVVPQFMNGQFNGYYIAGFGMIPRTAFSLTIYTSGGKVVSSAVSSTDANGAFLDASDLLMSGSIYSGDVAGTYGVVLSMSPSSSATYEFFASYTVYSALEFTQTTTNPAAGYFTVQPMFNDFIGDTVTVSSYGLSPGTYYDLYFGSVYLETVQATSVDNLLSNGNALTTFVVPTVPYGIYYVNLTYTGTTKVVASAPFNVLPDYYGSFYLYTAQGTPTETAFPGELVNFLWTPSVSPATFSATATTGTAVFQETGMPSGTSWYVDLNGVNYPSSSGTPSSTITVPDLLNGPYSFTIRTVNLPTGYVVNPSAGSIDINGNTVTIDVTFSTTVTPTPPPTQGIYAVNFTESGLPAGTMWTIEFAPGSSLGSSPSTYSSSTAYINVTGLQPGQYTYSIESASNGYVPTVSTATITVDSNTVTVDHTYDVSVQFIPGYAVTFEETGLPTGTFWNVTFNGAIYGTTSSSITVYGSGTSSYTVYTQPGNVIVQTGPTYVGKISGSVTGASSVTVTFAPAVTFMFSGIPESDVSSSLVTLTNTTTGKTATALFTLGYGVYFGAVSGDSYSYTINPPSPYIASPSSGTFTWQGEPLTIDITMYLPDYTVIFDESGLASGTSWTVTLSPSGQTMTSTSSSITFNDNVTYGSYTYTASASGYETLTGSITGKALLATSGTLTVTLTFTPAPVTYSAIFMETGLPAGDTWYIYSVTTGLSYPSSPTTSSTITIPGLTNGDTYTFSVETSSDYIANPSSVTETINGANVFVSITFSAPLQKYTEFYMVSVVVNFNGTAYSEVINATVTPIPESSAVMLSGSFVAPNAAPGSYWGVTLTWTQKGFSYNTNVYYTSHNIAFLELVSGAGAVMMSISSSQVATIETSLTSAVSSAVTTDMQVPLSELNATVVELSGTTAQIKTAFGNMTATLSAINASVVAINKGVATVSTALGNVETSLASLNASIVSLNGAVALIQTSVGDVQTSLNSLAPVIMSINGTTAMISTEAGMINMNLTAFHNATLTAINNGIATVKAMNTSFQASLSALNAQLVSVNGNIATVQTSLGTVQTSLSSLNATVTSINGNVATISTSLGTLSGTVTSVSNGVATIQTNLGTLQASVNGVNGKVGTVSSSVSNTEIFEIVVLVLVLITLVLAFLSMNNVNKLSKKLEEQKKQ